MTEAPPPPYRAAALAGTLVLVLYVLTLAPTTAFWDASEYITTAYILGVPHPPGTPLFVALGPAGVIAAIVAVEAAVWWKSRARQRRF